jgi:hypothetical protein
MGGRGTFASGNNVAYSYETVGKIEGVKVLKGLNGKHGLPEESHSSYAYIKLKHDGTFHEMRIYDKDHYLVKEIAYHPEPNIDKSGEPVLHVHEYKRDNFQDRPAKPISEIDYNMYKKYFKGVPKR